MGEGSMLKGIKVTSNFVCNISYFSNEIHPLKPVIFHHINRNSDYPIFSVSNFSETTFPLDEEIKFLLNK